MSAGLIAGLGETPRILLVRLSAIGDVVVTTPVVAAIRQRFPEAHLAWVVEERAQAIVADNPQLDEIIVSRRESRQPWWAHLSEIEHLCRKLRRRRFDVSIDFQGLLRSAVLGFRAGIPHRIGNTQPKEHCGLLYTHRVARPSEPSSRQRCLDLLRPLGIQSRDRRTRVYPTAADQQAAAQLIAEAPPAPNGYAALVPATSWEHKHWPEEHWSRLAQLVWRELGLLPIWMGAGVDRPLIERIERRLREADIPSFVTTGRTRRLKTAVAVLESSRLCISVDTALMHLAVAAETPTVALCGPSAWRGFQDYENFTLIHKQATHACMPCLHHPTCNMRVTCMRDITPGEVLQAARDRLGHTPLVSL